MLLDYSPPKFYPIVQTNEHGIKSYIYTCLFFEKVNFDSYADIKILNTTDQFTNTKIKVKEEKIGKLQINVFRSS